MAKVLLKSKLQRIACKKMNRYVTRAVVLPRINKDELLARAAANSGIRKGIIYSASDAISNEIENFLLNGHSIEVPVLGTFSFAVNASAAETEKGAGATAVYRRKIKYTPNVQLKRYLQTVNFEDFARYEEGEDDDTTGDGSNG